VGHEVSIVISLTVLVVHCVTLFHFSSQKGVDVNKKLMNYVQSHEDLHVRILMYEVWL